MRPPDSNQHTVEIHDGIKRDQIVDALRISYDAFALKFRIGFRNADDYVRLFHDQVNAQNCITATVDGELSGILTINTRGREFYKFSIVKLLARFNPIRASRILFNLAIMALEGRPSVDVFMVETLVVDPRFRGMGIGTKLLEHAETVAANWDKRKMVLDVIDENDGARRLYERRGYKVTKSQRGFPLQLVGTRALHTMEKVLNDGPDSC